MAQQIAQGYPNLHTIIGSLDDARLLETEAAKASIVVNAAANKHMGAAKAIHSGLKKHGTTPSYWIQISGASALAAAELADPFFDVGRSSDVVFNDLEGVAQIRELVRAHPSRQMDNYMLNVQGSDASIHTALVLPPLIYGRGEGPAKKRSVQLPELIRVTLEKGHAVRAGPGLNRWGNTHVADVGRLFAALVNEADKGNTDQLWGEDGVYFTSYGEMVSALLLFPTSRKRC